ncbi:MAG TPA: protein kinase [Gemmatales bacterium]|nr:protein kinase [Gemmatales bacterium]
MSSSLASIDEVARRQYEQAWRTGRPDSINRFLPSTDSPQYLATLEELVHIEIEMTWKAWKAGSEQNGQRALPDSVEVYLERFPQLKQDDIVQRLIEEECRARKLAGHRPHEDEYGKRFPQLTMKKHLFTDNAVQTNKNLRNNTSTLQPGSRLGRYQLTSEHSRGSFGIVWKADDLALGRSVALKQLKDYLSNRPEYRHRFFAEAKITAQLQHPGIVPIHEIGGEDEGFTFYTMNMVGGDTLAQAIANYHQNKTPAVEHSVEWHRLMNAYLTVVRTMAFAHSRNILHRDLKPANIILGKYGETLILDWGLAKVIKDDEGDDQPASSTNINSVAADVTQPGSIIGTPAYMSPEQASGKPEAIRAPSDVYSLGVILYELLTGQRPLQGDSAEVVHQLIEAKPIVPPSQMRAGIARQLEAICLKAIAHDPKERYAHADLLRADLELYLADEPVEAYPEPWWMRAGRWIRRHKALATGTTVALLLLLIGSIVGYFLWSAAELKRQQEVQARLLQLHSNTMIDDEAAATELKAGRYSSVVVILDRAVLALEGEPGLADDHQRLSARRDRIKRIAEFTLLADRAEEHAAMDRDAASVTAAEKALALVFVTDHLSDWWLHLPVADLEPEQVSQVREDASRLLLLLSLQRIKLGVLTIFGGKSYYENALKLIPAIQNYHQFQYGGPAHTGLLLEQFCYKQLGQKDRLKPLTTWNPRGPSDHFYMGICHFYLGSLSSTLEITSILPASVSSDLRSLGGLDLDTPTETGLSMLRMAATLEPRRYWTYNWLGWCNFLKNDYEAASQAFGTAISLRPQQWFAYTQRAMALTRKVNRTRAVSNLQSLIFLGTIPINHPASWIGAMGSSLLQFNRKENQEQQTLLRLTEGLAIGIQYDPHESTMHLLQSNNWLWLKNHQLGLQSLRAGLLYAVPLSSMAGDAYPDFMNVKDDISRLQSVWQPLINNMNDAEAWATSALAYHVVGPQQHIQTCIELGLKAGPATGLLLAVRGHLQLKQNKLDVALSDLTQANQLNPNDFLITAGLARYYELTKEWDQALGKYLRLEDVAKTPWQHVEAHLGQARSLINLNRHDDARQALKGVEEIAPRTIAMATRKLFPAPPTKSKP